MKENILLAVYVCER